MPLALLAALCASAITVGGPAAAASRGQSTVTICHATSSASNPYNRITIDPDAVFRQGHDAHQGGRDIIPPFTYESGGTIQHFPGSNWDAEGAAILANQCAPIDGPGPIPPGIDAEIPICHRVDTPTWVRVLVPVRDVGTSHAGVHPDDIIPPYAYLTPSGRLVATRGQNWDDEGQAIYDAGCVEAGFETEGELPIGLAVTCVRAQPNGSYDAVFGYVNPNPHDVTVKAGDANSVTLAPGDPGPVDRGQPTVFTPAGSSSAFVVRGTPRDRTVTWRVAHQGTVTATAGADFPVLCDDGTPAPPGPDASAPLAGVAGVYVSCVRRSAAGTTYSATFGYVNPGSAVIEVPVGPGNQVTGLARSATGQPTHFVPGALDAAFTIRGIPARRTATWGVVLPSGRRATAVASIAGPSCPGASVRFNSPGLTTRVHAPRVSRLRTPTRWVVSVGNQWNAPAYGVVVRIPTPVTESSPNRVVTTSGITCGATIPGIRGATACRVPVLLPGMTQVVGFRSLSLRVGRTRVVSRATGRSVAGARLRAADSTPLRVIGPVPAVTG